MAFYNIFRTKLSRHPSGLKLHDRFF